MSEEYRPGAGGRRQRREEARHAVMPTEGEVPEARPLSRRELRLLAQEQAAAAPAGEWPDAARVQAPSFAVRQVPVEDAAGEVAHAQGPGEGEWPGVMPSGYAAPEAPVTAVGVPAPDVAPLPSVTRRSHRFAEAAPTVDAAVAGETPDAPPAFAAPAPHRRRAFRDPVLETPVPETAVPETPVPETARHEPPPSAGPVVEEPVFEPPAAEQPADEVPAVEAPVAQGRTLTRRQLRELAAARRAEVVDPEPEPVVEPEPVTPVPEPVVEPEPVTPVPAPVRTSVFAVPNAEHRAPPEPEPAPETEPAVPEADNSARARAAAIRAQAARTAALRELAAHGPNEAILRAREAEAEREAALARERQEEVDRLALERAHAVVEAQRAADAAAGQGAAAATMSRPQFRAPAEAEEGGFSRVSSAQTPHAQSAQVGYSVSPPGQAGPQSDQGGYGQAPSAQADAQAAATPVIGPQVPPAGGAWGRPAATAATVPAPWGAPQSISGPQAAVGAPSVPGTVTSGTGWNPTRPRQMPAWDALVEGSAEVPAAPGFLPTTPGARPLAPAPQSEPEPQPEPEPAKHPYTWLHLIVLVLVAFVLGMLVFFLLLDGDDAQAASALVPAVLGVGPPS